MRHIGVIKELLPGLGIDALSVLTGTRRAAEGLDLVGTAGRILAAQVCVAVALDVVELQGADGLDIAVGHCVGVPGLGPAIFVTVDEGDGGGKVVVVFDNVLKIGQAFATFVDGGVFGSEGVVDRVDDISPSVLSAHIP